MRPYAIDVKSIAALPANILDRCNTNYEFYKNITGGSSWGPHVCFLYRAGTVFLKLRHVVSSQSVKNTAIVSALWTTCNRPRLLTDVQKRQALA